MRRSLCSWLAIVVLMTPLPLAAQSTADGLANLVPELILKGIKLPGGDLPGTPHAGISPWVIRHSVVLSQDRSPIRVPSEPS